MLKDVSEHLSSKTNKVGRPQTAKQNKAAKESSQEKKLNQIEENGEENYDNDFEKDADEEAEVEADKVSSQDKREAEA